MLGQRRSSTLKRSSLPAQTKNPTSRLRSLLPPPTRTPAAKFRAPLPPDVKEKLRHNFRRLLRECSYLPDSWARKWMHQHVIRRYRDYEDSDNSPTKTTLNAIQREPSITTRMASKLLEGRRAIFFLYRANNGELKPLRRVLLLAYGRIGRRRHELMKPLLVKQGVDERLRALWLRQFVFDGLDVPDSVILDALSVMSTNVSPKKVKDFPIISPLLHRLAKSQQQYAVNYEKSRATLRSIEPSISGLNTWLRPMPGRRTRNLALKGYATFLSRLEVPAPRLEWERLRRLALGLEQEDVPRRRKSLAAKRNPLDLLVKDKWGGNEAFGHRGQKYVAPRAMQKLYRKVFDLCPKVTWDTEARSFDVVWGRYE